MLHIEPEHLSQMFVKATKQVFHDMLEVDIDIKYCELFKTSDLIDKAKLGLTGDIRGVQMDFTGDFDGELFLYYNNSLAMDLTRGFFKLNDVEMEDDELAESIDDILGELTNMTVGLFKSAMLHTDLKCMIGLPKPFHDGSTGVRPDHTILFRNVCAFTLYGDIMISDIIMYG